MRRVPGKHVAVQHGPVPIRGQKVPYRGGRHWRMKGSKVAAISCASLRGPFSVAVAKSQSFAPCGGLLPQFSTEKSSRIGPIEFQHQTRRECSAWKGSRAVSPRPQFIPLASPRIAIRSALSVPRNRPATRKLHIIFRSCPSQPAQPLFDLCPSSALTSAPRAASFAARRWLRSPSRLARGSVLGKPSPPFSAAPLRDVSPPSCFNH